jgi:hypothetical protein
MITRMLSQYYNREDMAFISGLMQAVTIALLFLLRLKWWII